MNRSANLALALHAAAQTIAAVRHGRSLSDALLARAGDARVQAAAQDLAYGALRHLGLLEALLAQLLQRKAKPLVYALLLAALYQLRARPESTHTTVDQAVEAAALLQPAAKGLVNAVLRTYLRDTPALLARANSERARYSYPQWWIRRVRHAWPRQWSTILDAANQHPPMTLRVNARRTSVAHYLEVLAAQGIRAQRSGTHAITLAQPLPVSALPGFAHGDVSVQDHGAQLAAPLLDVRAGMRVLDACAAPGGKTGHLLELADCALTAIDNDAGRLARVEANLQRLRLRAQLVCADCCALDTWFDGARYERILLDAPCTASGVVRRHPDIKWLRRERDVDAMAATQARMLDALWHVLAPGGKLLYATCSVFPQENSETIDKFLARNHQARLRYPEGLDRGQLLPDALHDGFFYALLEKTG